MGILISLGIGALAGWLAGQIMKGSGQGLLLNIVVGIIGGLVGNFVFGLLGIQIGSEILGAIITATVGAVILLFIVGKLRR